MRDRTGRGGEKVSLNEMCMHWNGVFKVNVELFETSEDGVENLPKRTKIAKTNDLNIIPLMLKMNCRCFKPQQWIRCCCCWLV